MSMHKQKKGGTVILNNDKLVEQIRLCIIGDYNNKLYADLPDGRGETEYNVRDGVLQRNTQIRKMSIMDDNESIVVLSRKGLELLLKKTESRLKKWKPIDYGIINLHLVLDENGDIIDISITVRVEQHFKRF
ncbi:hypothetical protein [Paenibacillus periandrae]|uniref:hypothetical protein n=1 Tax=Paenibacillus periandrae TaxID=1761741 RepID=UPI001F095A44|nr:hypothetical protein [Paenibacillus periandrae]